MPNQFLLLLNPRNKHKIDKLTPNHSMKDSSSADTRASYKCPSGSIKGTTY